MVRASLGLYSTDEDIEALLTGVRDLLAKPDRYRTQYQVDSDGNFRHRTFDISPESLFDPEAALRQALAHLVTRPDVL
jgi:hypothetical protein